MIIQMGSSDELYKKNLKYDEQNGLQYILTFIPIKCFRKNSQIYIPGVCEHSFNRLLLR